ncbi:hypothetical protein D9619_009678 [Psilocybe cf. subviscida]|uniref:Copper-fist domain-containing protein n=1 Tax=Psilocybe cf. subviscida TaxID=2480587 RepID=A0A8H5BLM8_9AGAR|nr:hypothetical protein D9619_009678 [Psilocybe cf. subviscida]
MIISTKKYACETCIKGHRSSACKHTDRPLFEIKKKGRPVTQCEHCRELRKTKQVHVKCLCEQKADLAHQGSKSGFESATFPNGLPESLGASVAFQTPGEGTSSDSDHGGMHHGPQCKSGDPCACITPRTRTRVRGDSDLSSSRSAGGSSRRCAVDSSAPGSSSQILARIQELRPLVPRPPPSGSSHPMSGNGSHNPSAGIPHGHTVSRHHDTFAPYGRVNGMVSYQTAHPQSYVLPPGPPNSMYPYTEQMFADPSFPNTAGSPNPSQWGLLPESGSGVDSNAAFHSLSMCGCGDGCACPGCVHHNRATNIPTSSAYASCQNPNHCATCLDCTIMSLPASAIFPVADTALSIPDGNDNSMIDEWLRHMSASDSFNHQGHNNVHIQQQQSSPANWDNTRGFSTSNMSSNGSFNNNYYGQSPRTSNQDAMIDPRLLPPFSGNLGMHRTQERSRSPSSSSQSSLYDSDGCCNPSSGAGTRRSAAASAPPCQPNGRVQAYSSQQRASAPALNIRPAMARGPGSAASSNSSPRSTTRPGSGRPYCSQSSPQETGEYEPHIANHHAVMSGSCAKLVFFASTTMSERSSEAPSVVSLSLAPRAGFCIKTTTLEGANLPISHEKSGAPTSIPGGLKVFVNIAWDVNAPPSPQGSEEAIERVLNGEEDDIEEESMGGLYIPAILSPLREDRDKAGNPSLVFDCIYNTTVKARVSGNEEYKAFIVELALQRIEGQTGLILSREIRTPNIASKGKLLPRTATIPASLLVETPTATQSSGSSNPASNERGASDQRISSRTAGDSVANGAKQTEEEGHEAFSQAILEMLKALPTTEQKLSERESSPISAVRNSTRDEGTSTITSTLDSESNTVVGGKAEVDPQKATAPRWSWWREDSGCLCIEIEVPELTADLARNSTLDIEPRRLLLEIPDRYALDINLALPDADIEKSWTGGGSSTGLSVDSNEDHIASNIRNALNLKRERDLDVDAAEAEWKVGSGLVIIRV